MNQVQRFKAAKALRRIQTRMPAYKSRRLAREFDRDIDIALQYAAMVDRVRQHNVAACAYAPRASPVIH